MQLTSSTSAPPTSPFRRPTTTNELWPPDHYRFPLSQAMLNPPHQHYHYPHHAPLQSHQHPSDMHKYPSLVTSASESGPHPDPASVSDAYPLESPRRRERDPRSLRRAPSHPSHVVPVQFDPRPPHFRQSPVAVHYHVDPSYTNTTTTTTNTTNTTTDTTPTNTPPDRLTRISSRRSLHSLQPSLHSTPSTPSPLRHASYHADAPSLSNGGTAATTLSSFLGRRRARRRLRKTAPPPPPPDGHITLQGYCRMTWFARLRCTRYLRLVRNSLHCFDAALRHHLWVVVLHGARVRIHMPHKIVLSKLQCGFLVEFYVYDEQSCKHWASALLHASSKT